MIRLFIAVLLIFFLSTCANREEPTSSLLEIASAQEQITGASDYLASPFVTAGDRVYMVGHQDGSFPDLGWHISGEMGGIWDHPIKLMDGFTIHVRDERMLWTLDSASLFQNFPFGNLHTFKSGDLQIDRFQFVPDGIEGLIVELSIANNSPQPVELEVDFVGHVDLRPTWLSERENIEDGKDEGAFDQNKAAYVVKDSNNPWFVLFGADLSSKNFTTEEQQNSNDLGKDFALKTSISLAENTSKTMRYFVAGSYESRESAFATYDQLTMSPEKLLLQKIERYKQVASTNTLTSNDEGLDQMFRWIKYNTQWLVRDVPEVGRGVSAGIPDYPWWFGTDGAYIIQGMLSAGMHEEAMNTIDLILDLSRKENGNGRIVHEVSSNGIVFNPGNLNTTPTFISSLWKAYQWTGDQRIIDAYYDDVIQGIEWIDRMDKDENGFPDGAGMMEIHGLHSEMIDVVAYLAKAYEATANFATVKGEKETAEKYRSKADHLIRKINTEWWVQESKSFADFRSSKEEALELIEAAIVRADTINKPWSVTELQETKKNARKVPEDLQGFVVHHNWVVNTPMEVGIADQDKAQQALETAKKYQNRFGMFVTGIDRDENQEKAEKWKAFSYVGAVMTLPTGVQAISEARYGNAEASLAYLKLLQNSFSYALPGSMYEVSPDFGMVAQGWNVYAVAVPIVDYFFGIQPEAFNKRITIKPQMPASWNQAKLENIKIGENELTILFKREAESEHYTISQKLDWEIVFDGNSNQKGIIQ